MNDVVTKQPPSPLGSSVRFVWVLLLLPLTASAGDSLKLSTQTSSIRVALCTETPECLQESNPAAASSSSTSIRITRRRNSSSATPAGGSCLGSYGPRTT